ncbi:hypothetical protein C8A05DRAFT_42776 [Staphylotrichum tortipilum]|uniref:NAD-dependent epimerase/dehydratase domain-containing protein n=1 Tax=Staphylotrichum tortipilum TaxID=2831512 RepID=A0AAN6MNW5_9PEZI|nr:hypothetical protein C8A05DRAFT_42776 [Staphylotrichum longicolle]
MSSPSPLESTNILITGAAGFIGPLLAAHLVRTPHHRLLLTDLHPPPPIPSSSPSHITTLTGDLTHPSFIPTLLSHPSIQPLHTVFLLHGIMSSTAESNPALSAAVNIDATRTLLSAISALPQSPKVRIIYTCSLAVFGPPFPPEGTKIPPHWAPTPQSTYGAHKLVCEALLNEAHRRGEVEVFIARLPTVVVRPGRPTGAASGFWSGMVREPMNGEECVVPVRERGLKAWVASPRVVVENLGRLMKMEVEVSPAHARQVMLPGVVVSIQEMRDAVGKYGGEEAVGRIREVEDEGVGKIVRSWGVDFDIEKGLAMGLVVDEGADQLVREYVEVLCVGLPRTGTESLQQALLHLGYDHTYHGWDIVYDKEVYSPGWVALARKKWYARGAGGGLDGEGRRKGAVITAGEFDELLGHSVAVTDAAASVFAAEMVAAYPEAKVVLNMRRDLDAWEKSLDGTLVHANESWGFWIASWLDRECFWAWHVYERFLWPLLFRAPEGEMKTAVRGNARWIQREHANMIRGLVHKDRLLEWYIEDGWEPLCKFLDKPVPDIKFPHANAVTSGWKAREEQCNKRWVERAFGNLILLGIGLVASIVVARMYLVRGI